MLALFRRFLTERHGQVAILFGMMLIPIVSLVGASIDMSRAVSAKSGLADAVDAALLALSKEPAMSDDEAKAFIRELTGHMLSGVHDETLDFEVKSISQVDNQIDVRVEGSIDATMMGIVGFDELGLGLDASVIRESRRIEVALVLDNTGSMNSNGKIGALRSAAGKLVEILTEADNADEFVDIALVPFVTSVNINRPGAINMGWLDQNAQARYHGINFDEASGSVNHFDLFDDMDVDWKGCVEARAEPFDLDDTPPNIEQPDTLWVPYFWPDEPNRDSHRYNNNYMDDGRGGSHANRQRHTGKYGDETPTIDEIPTSTSGPNKSCPQPLLPLTNNFDQVQGEIDGMIGWNASGTNIALGMSWGWRVLSPGEPFTEGVDYDDDETMKAMIVLTDGENVVWGGWDGHNSSDYTGYGYLAIDGDPHRLGSIDRYSAASNVNDRVEILCQRIKDRGIRLYTITFQLNSISLRNLFRDCASAPGLYFNSPTNEQLQDAFELIAFDLSNLRLSK
ncbi:MAG: pilus assembly protein TadG-related protein [Pseudomonadota bacterium]